MFSRLPVLGVLLLVISPMARAEPIIREPGAIYLSDFDQRPLQLAVLHPAACYFDIGLTRYAGTLRFPQAVKVEAVSNTAARIRGNAQQGGVAAWVPFKDLQPLPDGLLTNLKKSEERRRLVDALISRNEVALGMTLEEVKRSLGKPQKTTKRADQSGTSQIWEFVKYALVPQTTYAPGSSQVVVPGQGSVTQSSLYPSTIYVKVPVGTLKVTFKDGIVDSLDQSEGTPATAAPTVVVPPVDVVW